MAKPTASPSLSQIQPRTGPPMASAREAGVTP